MNCEAEVRLHARQLWQGQEPLPVGSDTTGQASPADRADRPVRPALGDDEADASHDGKDIDDNASCRPPPGLP